MRMLLWFGVSGIWITCLCSCKKNSQQQFKAIPPSASGVQFSNTLTPTDSLNIIEYLYYYNGSGVATGDINNDGLPDIYLCSNQQENKLYLNKGLFKFEDITSASHAACPGDWKTGVSMIDINGDGWLDIYVCEVGDYKSLHGRNQLFINNHDLTFTESAASYGLDFVSFSTQAAWLDYDHDGDLDIYLLCHSVHSTDTYRDTSIRHVIDTMKGDRLMRNDGGHFHNVSQSAGILSSPIGYGLGVAVADVNNDGWTDILVGNDFHENDYLYLNNQQGGFTQSQYRSFGHTSTFSMGNDIADINGDGLMDMVSLDMKPDDEIVLKNSVGADPYDIYQYKIDRGYHYQYPRNTLQLNQYIDGKDIPYFSEIGQQLGIARTDWSWSPLLADFDNNGYVDLFVANGIMQRPNDLDYLKYYSGIPKKDSAQSAALIAKMPHGKAKNFFFSQNGPMHFEDVSQDWNPVGKDLSTAAAYADFDGDGDLDLIINRINEPATLLQNKSKSGHHLQLQLKDRGQNGFAIGARATVYAASRKWITEVSPTRGFQSSSDYTLHVGLGEINKIDSIAVKWNDGTLSTIQHPTLDTLLKINRKDIASYADPGTSADAPLLQPVSSGIDFIHRENYYNDFEREKLLLYKLSTQGPSSAISDINGDGLDDVWIGGARDQSGVIYLQGPNGQFSLINEPALIHDAAFEDVDGTWQDIDGDHDMDLIVVSGGYQLDNPTLLHDRAYLNDGKGNLTYSAASLPNVSHMSSCIAANDVDQDGDIDLFIGGRVAPYYGFNTDSYLLINDGKGNYSISVDPVFHTLGMVTGAAWADVDGDHKNELIVSGEWSPIFILKNVNNKWTKQTIEHSNGLWQTVKAVDMDQDGDIDLIAGNFGLNHELKASGEEPVNLYAADFDQNTTPEAIISYYVHHKEYSFFSKDELANQIVSLRKKYTDYHSFASTDFMAIFPGLKENKNHRTVTTMSSTVFKNDSHGKFEAIALPQNVQSSVIFSILPTDINGDHLTDLILGGNLFEVTPSLGRMDASYGHVLINKGNMEFKSLSGSESGLVVPGAIRDIKELKANNKAGYLIVRNGSGAVLFQ